MTGMVLWLATLLGTLAPGPAAVLAAVIAAGFAVAITMHRLVPAPAAPVATRRH